MTSPTPRLSKTTIEDLPTELKLRILQMVTRTSRHSPKSLISLAQVNREFFAIYCNSKRLLQIEFMGTYLPEAQFLTRWKPVLENIASFGSIESDEIWPEMKKVLPTKPMHPSKIPADEINRMATLHRKLCGLLWDARVGPDAFCFNGRPDICWQAVRYIPEREEHMLSCIYGFYGSCDNAMDSICAIKHRCKADIDYFWDNFYSCYTVWVEPEIMGRITTFHDAIAKKEGIELDPTDEVFARSVNFMASAIIRFGPSVVYDLLYGKRKEVLNVLHWIGSLGTERLEGGEERVDAICDILSHATIDDIPLN